MNTKPFWFALACMPLAACATPPAPANAKPNYQFGWMAGSCVALQQADIAAHQVVTIVALDDHNTASTGVITGKAVPGEACPPLLSDRADFNTAEGNHFYALKSAPKLDAAIVIVGAASTRGLQFASCTTEEGIRFMVSDGKSVVWKGYYYLGYDTTPTCAGGGEE
jgi:hypothetical protein